MGTELFEYVGDRQMFLSGEGETNWETGGYERKGCARDLIACKLLLTPSIHLFIMFIPLYTLSPLAVTLPKH